MAGKKERFAEVAGHDRLGSADGGEVHAGVPAEQQIDVDRYLVELDGGERVVKKRLEQGGDAGGTHCARILVDCRGGWYPVPGIQYPEKTFRAEEILYGRCRGLR